MKILHLIPGLTIGGVAQLLYNFLTHNNISPTEHLVAYIHPGPFVKKIKMLGFQTHHLKKHRYDRYSIGIYWQLHKLTQKLKPNLLHSWLSGTATVALVIGKIKNIPVICDFHSDMDYKLQRPLHSWFTRKTSNFATAYVSATKYIDSFIRERFTSCKKSKFNIIYVGLPSQQASPITTRKKLGLPPNAFIIGSTGRLEPIKSFDILIRAFHVFFQKVTMNKSPQSVKLCLIGGGSQRVALEVLTKSLGISKHVIFTGYKMNVKEYLPLFDCFALSSQTEAISMAILEALAVGLPVVTTHFQTQHEAIINGVHGYHVPLNDHEAFANALYKVFSDASLRSKIQQNNICLVQKKFSLNRMVKEYMHIFEKNINTYKKQ